MNNSLQKITYETSLGTVDLDFQTVKNYLVRGAADKITDQEVILFMKTCQAQKLNPFAQGEAYLIKFGSDPAQMVVGVGAYMRRAEENPAYRGHKAGIVVLRGDQVIQKEGTCLYPGESLLGGWCRVRRARSGSEEEIFKEVSLKEYDKGQANWKTKPCTMIEKVAVSQALRAAFPKDYEGMYVAEEVSEQGYTDAEYEQMDTVDGEEPIDMTPISQEQRKTLFRMVHQKLGKEDGNALVQAVLSEFNLESTNGMPVSTYHKVMDRVMEVLESCGNEDNASDADHEEGPAE